jgi:hypothetical protein
MAVLPCAGPAATGRSRAAGGGRGRARDRRPFAGGRPHDPATAACRLYIIPLPTSSHPLPSLRELLDLIGCY